MGHYSSETRRLYYIVMAVILIIGAFLTPFFKTSNYKSKRKVCTDEVQAYIESVDIREENKSRRYGSSSAGRRRYSSVQYYNVVECKYEYKGQEYSVSKSFRTSKPIAGADRYTTIYVEPANPRHILFQDEEDDLKGSYTMIKFFGGVAVFIIVIIAAANALGFNKKR